MIYIQRRIEILIIIVLIPILFLGLMKLNNQKSLDNFLIFNLFENSNNKKYIFDISSKQEQKESVNLYSTLDLEGLVNEKIFPGTNGEFEIILKSSGNINYQISFDSKNVKPKNLKFNIKGELSKYDTLENLEEKLKGKLNKGRKTICIEWSWSYEIDENNNFQDTMDGMNIQEYNFDINVISY